MSATAEVDQGKSDKTPATLSNNKTGGDEFLGHEGEDNNRTTHDPLHHGVGDGDRTSTEAAGFSSAGADGVAGEESDTQKGGGGL